MDLINLINSGDSEGALNLIAIGKSNPCYVDEECKTPLIYACEHDMPEVALAILATGDANPEHVNYKDYYWTALMYACGRRYSDVAMAILATGKANVVAIAEYGESAFKIACEQQMSEVAIAIISSESFDPGHIDYGNWTPLIYACEFKSPDVALALLATGKSNPGHVSSCAIFINDTHDGYCTALIIACHYKFSDVALAILATGESNPKHVTSTGNTAYSIACANEMKEVVAKMIEIGADFIVSEQDKKETMAKLEKIYDELEDK